MTAPLLGQSLGVPLLLQPPRVQAIGAPEVAVKEVQLQGIDREQLFCWLC